MKYERKGRSLRPHKEVVVEMDEFRKPRKPRRTPKDATAKARVAEDAADKVATLEVIRLKIEAPGGSVEIPV